MAERMVREEFWSHGEFVLTSGTVAEKGNVACADLSASAEVCPSRTDTDLIPIGLFEESFTGNGTRKVRVRFFTPKRLFWLPNDGTNPVAVGDIFSDCYLTPAGAASILSTGRSKAGRVWAVSAANGVLVEMAG
ncbi:hypothetical protein [Sandaracinus amylolyticus]|uniref:Uncharacterized protein n=1 Tax=Sandaracinus amylolyticus TaxID=927083 RepID=A0A0F6YIR5_9BACT|nr:hypothetical protein [Sandaracinus amylolyticus]AKF06072.1 hypothetical protein DB32_003221 [Sandaracinus amylolyticus]